MDIIGKARKLESRIERTLNNAVQGLVGPASRQPLEVLHALLDAVEQHVQPAGRGRRVFPFNRVIVYLRAESRAARAQYEAVIDSQPSLRERILERLRSAGCQVDDLEVTVAYPSKARQNWANPDYHIEFDRVVMESPPKVVPPREIPRLDLTVVQGTAERRTYSFSAPRIDIGRGPEVRDSRNRLIRTNHVVFTEAAGETNKSVSRKHAHIAYNSTSDEYRVRDEGSAHGTSLLRDGHALRVPSGSRGTRLLSGDELVLGHARVRVKIHEHDS